MSTQHKDSDDHTTPGRPKDSGSRQQTQAGQNSQTGSADLDEKFAGEGASDPGVLKPAGAK